MRRIDCKRKKLNKSRVDTFGVIPQLEGILQMTHIAGQDRTNAAAMGEEEIDDRDAPPTRVRGDGVPQLVDQLYIGYLVPDRVIYLLAILDLRDDAVVEIALRHRDS